MTTISRKSASHNRQQWYHPTLSPEHGVYVVLAVSFLTGAAAAQQWTWATTLALICAFSGFQAEHPMVLLIKRRRRWKPRFWVWVGIYGGIASAIAFWLFWQSQESWPLLAIYGAAIVTTLIDAASVWWRQQKSIWNELITFAAVCLSAPFAYVATVGTLSWQLVGLWILNALFFSSAIFTVKFRKKKGASVVPGLVFHSIAAVIVGFLWFVHWLAPITAMAFVVALVKFGMILWQKDWYHQAKIHYVAQIETGTSFLFFVIVALSLLPAHMN